MGGHSVTAILRRLDEWPRLSPVFGARKLTGMLNREGSAVGRKRVRRRRRRRGIFVRYRRPHPSVPAAGHRVFPYRLTGVEMTRPNHLWAADLTDLPRPRGFLELVALVDVGSRRVMAWRLSTTLPADFWVAALEDALCPWGCPESFNSDQGSQFTRQAVIEGLEQAQVRISREGRGRWLDHVFIERLGRRGNDAEGSRHAWESGAEAKAGFARYLAFDHGTRPHEALGSRTPDELYFRADAIQEVPEVRPGRRGPPVPGTLAGRLRVRDTRRRRPAMDNRMSGQLITDTPENFVQR